MHALHYHIRNTVDYFLHGNDHLHATEASESLRAFQ